MTQQVTTPIHGITSSFGPNNQPKPNFSRSEQQFYRPPTATAQHLQQIPVHRYEQPNHTGMGVLNYNAFSQQEYDELKEHFFRPPNASRPDSYRGNNQWDGQQGQAGMRTNDHSFNFNQMNMGLGISSSSELLDQPPRPPSRTNPFAKQ